MCYWDVDYWFGWVWGPQKKYVSGNGKHNLSLFCVWMEGGSTAVSCFPVWPGWRAKTIPDPQTSLVWPSLSHWSGHFFVWLPASLLSPCIRVSECSSISVSEYPSVPASWVTRVHFFAFSADWRLTSICGYRCGAVCDCVCCTYSR